ncbi:unnamed protein product [Diplocarpon coronariae]
MGRDTGKEHEEPGADVNGDGDGDGDRDGDEDANANVNENENEFCASDPRLGEKKKKKKKENLSWPTSF